MIKVRKAGRNLLVWENLGGLCIPAAGVSLPGEQLVTQGERTEKWMFPAVAATCIKAVVWEKSQCIGDLQVL